MRGQILRGDSILALTATFSRVMCVSPRADVSPIPSIEQFVMISGSNRGRGCGRDFGGHGSFGGRESYGGRQSGFDKASDNVSIAGGIIISLRNAEKSLITINGHHWLILTFLPLMVLLMLLHSLTLVLLSLPLWCYHLDEYDRQHQLEFSQTSHSVTHVSSSGMNAYIASP